MSDMENEGKPRRTYELGRQEGYDEGYQAGLAEGMTRWYNEGYEAGLQEGLSRLARATRPSLFEACKRLTVENFNLFDPALDRLMDAKIEEYQDEPDERGRRLIAQDRRMLHEMARSMRVRGRVSSQPAEPAETASVLSNPPPSGETEYLVLG